MKIVEVKGVVVFEPDWGKYEFKDFLEKKDFKDGSYKIGSTTIVFVCEHTITVQIPDNLDIIQPQLNSLDAQEKELKLQYHQAMNQIEIKRNNLLAIEYEE